MRREGRVRGKPTSKSRVDGRCKQGRRCRSCRDSPVEKSRLKSLGWHKRYAVDVITNPSLTDFCLQPSQLKSPFSLSESRELDDEGDLRVGILVATLNSMVESAFASYSYGYDDGNEAFQREFGNVVKGARFSQSVSEDESWSDVELSRSSSDDDWTMVDDDAV